MSYVTELATVVVLLLTLAIRALVVNRLIRSKLRLSLFAFGGYLLFPAAAVLAPGPMAGFSSIAHLLLALGAVNLVLVLAVNPWRTDKVPDRFPNILQDALIIGVFLVIATAVMGEKFLTTSAVGAVVIGFALQDTLGNTFAGLALQMEKPFRAGDWIQVASLEGQVREITWRATTLCTKSGNAITVPNNIISKEAILNFSRPEGPTRLQVHVGVSYDAWPNEVKAVILEALREAPLALRTPPPEVVVSEFGASAITYRVKFWVADYRRDDAARDQVLSATYYALRRAGLEIPYPIQVEYHRDWSPQPLVPADQRQREIQRVDLFAPLSAEDHARLASASVERLFASAQTIVRQGEAGESMFVVVRGRVRVSVGDPANEVATIGPGGYFGEMSLLTGDPRTADVGAIVDSVLLEITADQFRGIALANPEVVERVGLAVAERRLGLERSRTDVAAVAALPGTPRSFLSRVQQFLRLPLA